MCEPARRLLNSVCWMGVLLHLAGCAIYQKGALRPAAAHLDRSEIKPEGQGIPPHLPPIPLDKSGKLHITAPTFYEDMHHLPLLVLWIQIPTNEFGGVIYFSSEVEVGPEVHILQLSMLDPASPWRVDFNDVDLPYQARSEAGIQDQWFSHELPVSIGGQGTLCSDIPRLMLPEFRVAKKVNALDLVMSYSIPEEGSQIHTIKFHLVKERDGAFGPLLH